MTTNLQTAVSHPRLSDSEQEVGQAEPGDREATQGAMCSLKKRLSYPMLNDSNKKSAKKSQMTEKPLKELRAHPRVYPTRGSVTVNKKSAKQSKVIEKPLKAHMLTQEEAIPPKAVPPKAQ